MATLRQCHVIHSHAKPQVILYDNIKVTRDFPISHDAESIT